VKNQRATLLCLPLVLGHFQAMRTLAAPLLNDGSENIAPDVFDAVPRPPGVLLPENREDLFFKPLQPADPSDAFYVRPIPPVEDFAVTFKVKPVVEPVAPVEPVPTPLESKAASQRFWEAAIPSGGSPGSGGGPFSGQGGLSEYADYAELARHSQMQHRGPVYYALKLSAGTVYDDNISLGSSVRRRDFQSSIVPAARVQLGSDDSALRLGASYTGAVSWFARYPSQHTFEQSIGLDGGWSGSRLKTGFRLGTQSTQSSSPDAGERVGHRANYLGVTFSYPFTGKVSGELSGDTTQSQFDGLVGSHENRVQEFLTYEWSPKLQLGLGSTQGTLQADGGNRQTYNQALVRVVAQPSAKLGWSASFGNEWRHFESGEPSSQTPVFTAGANWQVTGRTSLSLDGSRRTFASASLKGQNYEATTVALSAREMLTSTVDGSVSLGYGQANYHAAAQGVQANREDEYYYGRLSLNWLINRKCSLGWFYEYNKNLSSGDQGHPFQRNRIGVAFNVSF
jgi:hypothetical protein